MSRANLRSPLLSLYRLTFLALLCACVVAAANSASATPITFIHTGSGSGALADVPFFDAPFTITSTANTDNRQSFGTGFWIDHDTSSIEIGGVGTFSLISGTRTFVNNEASIVGYSRPGINGNDLFNGPTDAAFAAWDMLSSIGPIAGAAGTLQWDLEDVVTDGGTLLFFGGDVGGTFQAIVPEPSTGVLLTVGLFTFALRLRPARFRLAPRG